MSRFPRAVIMAVLPLLGGCLGEPEIQDRWTRLEILEAQPQDATAFSPSQSTPVRVKARITYRELLTGFLVADLRAGTGITTDQTDLASEDYLRVAQDVDQILQSSVSLGVAARPVTGWDHLIQEVEMEFDGGVVAPTAADSSVAHAAATTVNATGLFLLLYFSDDVQEVELNSGEEIEVVNPVLSSQRDILSTGIEVVPGGAS